MVTAAPAAKSASRRRGKSTARLAANPNPMRWPVSGAMTSASAVKRPKKMRNSPRLAAANKSSASHLPAEARLRTGNAASKSSPNPASRYGHLPIGNHKHNGKQAGTVPAHHTQSECTCKHMRGRLRLLKWLGASADRALTNRAVSGLARAGWGKPRELAYGGVDRIYEHGVGLCASAPQLG